MENINVRIGAELANHVQQQISARGYYENASEYIRDLIRRDLKSQQQGWQWLAEQLAPAITASENDFIQVSATDVIKRNKK
jgi:putative addiction module CopG family antidote